MKLLLIGLLSLLTLKTVAQPCDPVYNTHIHAADSLYQQNQFDAAAQTMQLAFDKCPACISDWNYYNNAGYNARAGNKEVAFDMLFKAFNKGYHRYDHLIQDPDLRTLEADERWLTVLESVKKNSDQWKASFRPHLALELETILEKDQSVRAELQAMGDYPDETNRLAWQRLKEIDSLNVVRVTHLIDSAGWLGEQHVGRRGSTALFIVIQHADLPTQEKYLPLMRQAVKDGLAQKEELALLEDRVLIRNGKPQIYGSQIGIDENTGQPFLNAVQDPDQLNSLRLCVGLEPIATYLEHFGIAWDPEVYKKELPAIQQKLRNGK